MAVEAKIKNFIVKDVKDALRERVLKWFNLYVILGRRRKKRRVITHSCSLTGEYPNFLHYFYFASHFGALFPKLDTPRTFQSLDSEFSI